MTTLNAYASLLEFKQYTTARGGSVATDITDDSIIESLLKTASEYLNYQTVRDFNPTIETRYFDVPDADDADPRLLYIKGDLLEVLTLTNGDGTVISSTNYTLEPVNGSPHYGIRLKNVSALSWLTDSSGDKRSVISLNAVWGCHKKYSSAWYSATTAAEALDASETEYDLTDGTSCRVGDLIRFDDEFGYVSGVSSNTVTITRGENGSTAATHLTGIPVKIWRVMDEVKTNCLEIANSAYRRRFGQVTGASEQVTAAGIVVTPRDIPPVANDFIKVMRRRT